jgi:hypothetical protein
MKLLLDNDNNLLVFSQGSLIKIIEFFSVSVASLVDHYNFREEMKRKDNEFTRDIWLIKKFMNKEEGNIRKFHNTNKTTI